MAFENCIIKIAAILKDKLPDETAEKIIRELERRVDEFQKGDVFPELKNDFEAALIRAGDEMAAEEIRSAKIIQRNTLDNIRKKKVRRSTMIQVLGAKGAKLDDAIQAITVGIEKGVVNAKKSISAMQHSLSGRWLGGVTTEIEAAGLTRLFNSNALGREIARELQQLTTKAGNVGISGSKEALTMAKILHKYQRQALTRLNRAGADISTLEGFIATQTHDRALIRKAGFDKWMADIMPRLDKARTFNGENEIDYLKNVYNDIVSGKLLKVESADTARVAGFKGVGNIAKKHSRSRKLHFKDADAWYDYDQSFGSGNMGEMVLETLSRQAEDIILLETYGTNPKEAFDADIEFLRKKFRGDTEALDRITGLKLNQLENQFAEVDGSLRFSESPHIAKFTANLRAAQNMSKLGSVFLTSLADIPVKAAEIRFQGHGYLKGYLNTLEGVVEGRGGSERKQILGLIGAGQDALRGSGVARFAGNDVEPGFLTKYQRPFFKLTGLTWWNDAQKSATGALLSHHVAQNKNVKFSALDQDFQRVLGFYGIQDAEWNAIGKSAVKLADGREYITPDAIQALDDDVVKNFLGDTAASQAAIARAKDQLESQLGAYYIDRIEIATLTPGARENAILRQGLQPGTLVGDALKLITQYKQFPTSIMTKVWGRDLYAKGRIDTAALVHMSVMHTALGYSVLALKDMTAGKTPRDPELSSTWRESVVQGGAYGILGDLLLAETNRFGQSLSSQLVGPTFGGIVDDADRVMKDLVDGKDVRGSAARAGISLVPGQNLFYTRGAINHLFLYDIQEQMNPGYKKRLRKRAKERGQEFFIKP